MANDEPAAGESTEQAAEVNCHVGWGPKRVATDGSMPGNIPENTDDDARGPGDHGVAVPREPSGRRRVCSRWCGHRGGGAAHGEEWCSTAFLTRKAERAFVMVFESWLHPLVNQSRANFGS